MKPIVNSQLTGKWYKITRDFHSQEFKFTEIFIYLSLNENKKSRLTIIILTYFMSELKKTEVRFLKRSR